MKKSSLIFSSLFLLSFFIFSCQVDSKDKKEGADIKKTTSALAEKNSPNPENTISPLPLVKTESAEDKYVDWGSKPAASEDSPPETWTWTGIMCDGPSALDGKLKASSTLVSQGKNEYSVNNLCDDDPTTAWVEGKDDYGIGEHIELDWTPMSDGEITILNGYQTSKSVWENNSRIKKMSVSIDEKAICIVELSDKMGRQKFKIPGLVTTTDKGHEYHIPGPIRFTILEVYPGLKFKDTAISGLFSCGG